MGNYTQSNRPLAITTPLGPDALLLADLRGTEALSEPYCFRLRLLAQKPVAFDPLLGHPASVRLSVPGCPERHVHGLITRFRQGGWVAGPEGAHTFLLYEAELRPRLWLLGKRVGTRIFQDLSVPDILSQILREVWGLAEEDLQLHLSGEYLPRDYCVQYEESDLAFLSRLMEEEGIWYTFTHTADRHVLVLYDSPMPLPDLPGEATLHYDDGSGGIRADLRVTAWTKGQEIRECAAAVRDFAFQMPDSDLDADAEIPGPVPVGQASHPLAPTTADAKLLERFTYPAGYGWHFDGISRAGSDQAAHLQHLFTENARAAHLQIEREAAAALDIEGESPCGHLLPGCRFTLADHFDGDGGYYLTRVEHRFTIKGAYLFDAETPEYANAFAALPSALPYRPPLRTPRPRIHGVQTATVAGPAGDDLFVDPYGRVKVKFHWDRRAEAGLESSCWLRVGQLWAGNQWGAFFWPRIGHEVLVGFEGGDPDRPVIVGSVYNAKNMPPFTLPQYRSRAGIKSFRVGTEGDVTSSPHEHYNGFVFDDQAGQEHAELHGQRHIQFNSEDTHLHNVNGVHQLNVADVHAVQVGALPLPSGGSGDGNSVFQFSTKTDLKHGPGVSYSATFGLSAATIVGQNSLLVNGARMYMCIDPVAFFSEAFASGPSTAAIVTQTLTSMTGDVALIYGRRLAMHYANRVTINRSTRPVVVDTQNYKKVPVSAAAAAVTAVLATVGMIGASATTYDFKDDPGWEYVEIAAAALAIIQGHIEVGLAYAAQVERAAEAASAAVLTQNSATLTQIGDTLANLFADDSTTARTVNRTDGARIDYADYVASGSRGSMLLFSGRTTGEQSSVAMDPLTIRLAAGIPEAGPRIYITDEYISLIVGPPDAGNELRITADEIYLTVLGGTRKFTLGALGVVKATTVNNLTLGDEAYDVNTLNLAHNVDLTQTRTALEALNDVDAIEEDM